MDLNNFETLIEENGERIDLTFSKINEPLDLRQPAMDFDSFKIEASQKIILHLESATIPNKEKEYGFYGKVKPKYSGIHLIMTPTLKHSLKYHRTNGYFHMFLAPEIIKSADDYRGCSGAPIIDSEGKIVALACKVVEGSKIIYGFSIQECMKLIDLAIDANQL